MIRVRRAVSGAWVRAGYPSPSHPTIFGFNTNENDTFNQTVAGRQAWWNGRAPCVRRYNGGFLSSNSFPITTTVAPEKRVSYSFKADSSGSFTKSGLATGAGNARVTAWCQDIPANWTVYLTYYHEPNDEIRGGTLSVANYRDAYEQFRTAISAATLASGTQVFLTANFMAYRVADAAYFNDSWVPPLGTADILTFDIYGNPGHFTSQKTGPGYGTTYPNVNTRFRDMFAAIERNGFASSWGILELNTPGRDWDTVPRGEAQRAAWLVAATELCLNPPMTGSVPPEILLYWEAPSGVNWNQAFGRVGGNPLTCADAIAPYILGTP